MYITPLRHVFYDMGRLAVKTRLFSSGAEPDIKDIPIEKGVLKRQRLDDETLLEVLSPSGMDRFTCQIMKEKGAGSGFKGFYHRDWMNYYIRHSFGAKDSFNSVVRQGDEVLAYLTAGPLEKYGLYHPAVGRADAIYFVGLETKPNIGTGKGYGKKLAKEAVIWGRRHGYNLLASHTDNPRLQHIYSSSLGLPLIDRRTNIMGWTCTTYAIDEKLIQAIRDDPKKIYDLAQGLDGREKKPVSDEQFAQYLEMLSGLKGKKLKTESKRIQDMLASV